VGYGVDCDRDAIKSFRANTAGGVDMPFNPPGCSPAEAIHCTVGVATPCFSVYGFGFVCVNGQFRFRGVDMFFNPTGFKLAEAIHCTVGVATPRLSFSQSVGFGECGVLVLTV
jgi:hypothetical protein